jgi:hypothetical protein
MDATTLLAIALLALALCNVIHWVVARRGPLLWLPTGRSRHAWTAATVAVAVAAFATLSDWLPPHILPWLLFSVCATQQICSLVHRLPIAPAAF